MTKKRTTGKLLPFHVKSHRSENGAEGACCVAGKAASCADGNASSKQPSSESARTRIQVTVNLEPWCEEGMHSSRIAVDDDIVADCFKADDSSSKEHEVTIEEMRWLLSQSAIAESEPENFSTVAGGARNIAGSSTSFLKINGQEYGQHHALDTIVRRFAVFASRRISRTAGYACTLEPDVFTQPVVDERLRTERAVVSTFSMGTSQNAGFVSMDKMFAGTMLYALFGEGDNTGDAVFSLQNDSDGKAGFDAPVGRSVLRHFLHLLLLDMEWALAPFCEDELCISSGAHDEAPEPYDLSGEALVACDFSIFLGGQSETDLQGKLTIVFTEQLLAAIQDVLIEEQEGSAAEFEEMDDAITQRFRLMADEDLLSVLSLQSPRSVAVMLSTVSEGRRKALLAGMDAERQSIVTQNIGQKACFKKELTEGQQFVASALAMGEDSAVQMLSRFTLEAAVDFLREVEKTPSLYPEQVQVLLRQRSSSAGALMVDDGMAQRLMIRAIAPENINKVVSLCRSERVHAPFESVVRVPVATVANMLRGESVAVCRAIVLSLMHVDLEYANSLQQQLFVDTQLPTQLRLKEYIAPELIAVLEEGVVRQLTDK